MKANNKIKDLFVEVEIAHTALEAAIRVGKNKSVKFFAKEFVLARETAWKAAYKLYPELKEHKYAYDKASNKFVPSPS